MWFCLPAQSFTGRSKRAPSGGEWGYECLSHVAGAGVNARFALHMHANQITPGFAPRAIQESILATRYYLAAQLFIGAGAMTRMCRLLAGNVEKSDSESMAARSLGSAC